MVEDILDKIVVPDSRSTKSNVFKEDKLKKEEEKTKKEEKEQPEKEEKTKKEDRFDLHEKKSVFKKGEFDARKPVVFNIRQPGWIERGIFIAVILVLFYFAFFQNINFNIDLGNIFKGDVQPLVVKSEENSEDIEQEEAELSGEITFTVDKVNTEKYDTGVSKILGFAFTIDNQKEEFDAKIKYYAYDSSTPAAWKTKERGDYSYVIPIGVTTNTVDTGIVFSTSSTKTMRFELYDGKNTLSNITKEVVIS